MTDAANTPSTAPLQAESAAPSELSGLNARTARRQKLLLGSLGALALLGGSWFILGGDDKAKTGDPNAAQTIDTAGLVNRDLSQREFVATYGNRLDAVTREQKALKDGSIPRTEIEAQLAALKAENQAMRVDGQAAIDAISAENAELKTRLAAQPATTAPAVPPPAYGPQAGGYDARARSSQPGAVSTGGDPQGGMIPSPGEVKLMSFSSDKAGSSGLRVGRPDAPPVVVEDSPDYLPPNSYAPARVIVGVDASAGVASQTDPLPVVLQDHRPGTLGHAEREGSDHPDPGLRCERRGARRSQQREGLCEARPHDLRSAGRPGRGERGQRLHQLRRQVRGPRPRREPRRQPRQPALLAGIVGGFGRGFSANANSVFSGVTTNPDGSRSKLSAGDILTGGLGQGAADAADTVSKYLIERAEQYQPVVEMPTGIDVEIVFLDGVYVRNSQ
jgi:conjugal transfer pilus assembly protein TraB